MTEIKIVKNIRMKITKEMLYDLYYIQRKTSTEIAKMFGYKSFGAILNKLRKYDIPVRQTSEAQVNKIHIEKNILYNLYHIENKTTFEIAYQFKCSQQTIWRLLSTYNIEIKPKTRNCAGWNKGLTKLICSSLNISAKKISKKRKLMYKSGELVHHNLNKNLSLHTRTKISKTLTGKNRGELNPNWKGGDNNEYRVWRRRINNSLEYREFRKFIYTRDNYTCQKCFNISKGDIELHHIKKVCDYRELIMDKNNAITLCKKCHTSIKNKEERFEIMFHERILNNIKK